MSCGCEEQCTCVVQGDGTTTQVAGSGDVGDPYVVSALPGNEAPAGLWTPFAGFVEPGGWAWADGSTESRATEGTLFAAITFTKVGNTTVGTPTVTGLADTDDMWAGMDVEGANIPAGTTILSVDGPSQITLSQNATATGADTLRFFPWGNGDGATTFNKPDPRKRMVIGPGETTHLAGQSDGQTEAARSGPLHTHGSGGLATGSAGAHVHTVNITTGNPSTVQTGCIGGLGATGIQCLEDAANGQAGCSGVTIDGPFALATNVHTHTGTGSTNDPGGHTHPVTGTTDSDGPSWVASKWIVKL